MISATKEKKRMGKESGHDVRRESQSYQVGARKYEGQGADARSTSCQLRPPVQEEGVRAVMDAQDISEPQLLAGISECTGLRATALGFEVHSQSGKLYLTIAFQERGWSMNDIGQKVENYLNQVFSGTYFVCRTHKLSGPETGTTGDSLVLVVHHSSTASSENPD